MAGRSVGIRELKAHLSRYLKEVRKGRSVLVTDHGRPIGRIVPAAESLESRLKSMSQAGVIAWGPEWGSRLDQNGGHVLYLPSGGGLGTVEVFAALY